MKSSFAIETRDIHGGRAAQRVTCTKFGGGGVQWHSANIAVERGKPYTLRFWMKGNVQSPIYVAIRKHGAPYTAYLKRYIRAKDEWRPYLIIGEASDTDPRCSVFFMFADTGTLLLDDVSLQAGIHENVGPVDTPPQQGEPDFQQWLRSRARRLDADNRVDRRHHDRTLRRQQREARQRGRAETDYVGRFAVALHESFQRPAAGHRMPTVPCPCRDAIHAQCLDEGRAAKHPGNAAVLRVGRRRGRPALATP